MTHRTNGRHFVLCIRNRGYPASLETRKVYRALEDKGAAARGLLRIVDESGEDYLYPSKLFVPIDVPKGASRLFAGAST